MKTVAPAYTAQAEKLVGGPNRPKTLNRLMRPVPSTDTISTLGSISCSENSTGNNSTQQRGIQMNVVGLRTSKIASAVTYRQEVANELQQQGNAAVQAGEWDKAERYYSEAIEQCPSSVVLYSNRAFARQQRNKPGDLLKALQDAEHCTDMLPSWDRGWARKVFYFKISPEVHSFLFLLYYRFALLSLVKGVT